MESPSNNQELSMTFALYQEAQKDFEGFFGDESAALFDIFLSFQKAQKITGNFLEIGVYKGRSALMSGFHLEENEMFHLIDMTYFLDEVEEKLNPILGNRGKYHQSLSQVLTADMIGVSKYSLRWIHIDGEHTGRAVWNDLSLCEPLLSDEGILVLDDFFNPAYPQITEATFKFLDRYPYSLSLILTGWNKAYLARPLFARQYLEMIRETLGSSLHQRNIHDFVICKTTTREETSCYGIGRRWQDRDYYGLDSNSDDIP
jgi:hypothetical protein